jgi:hypothetical protein
MDSWVIANRSNEHAAYLELPSLRVLVDPANLLSKHASQHSACASVHSF